MSTAGLFAIFIIVAAGSYWLGRQDEKTAQRERRALESLDRLDWREK